PGAPARRPGEGLFRYPCRSVNLDLTGDRSISRAITQRQTRRSGRSNTEREGDILSLRVPATNVRRVLRTGPYRLGGQVRLGFVRGKRHGSAAALHYKAHEQ